MFSQGHGGKTDRDDAVSIGLAALDGDGIKALDARMKTIGTQIARLVAASGTHLTQLYGPGR